MMMDPFGDSFEKQRNALEMVNGAPLGSMEALTALETIHDNGSIFLVTDSHKNEFMKRGACKILLQSTHPALHPQFYHRVCGILIALASQDQARSDAVVRQGFLEWVVEGINLFHTDEFLLTTFLGGMSLVIEYMSPELWKDQAEITVENLVQVLEAKPASNVYAYCCRALGTTMTQDYNFTNPNFPNHDSLMSRVPSAVYQGLIDPAHDNQALTVGIHLLRTLTRRNLEVSQNVISTSCDGGRLQRTHSSSA